MPRNSGGVYSPPTGTYGISGTPISSSAYDTFINDLSTELTNSLNVQGTAPMLAPLNMGTFPINNVGAPVAATDAAIKSYVDAVIPAGMIAGFSLDSGVGPATGGWIECQGYSLSTTTYARLFAAIGYTYGGSGANFNIPDYRGCFLRGYDGGRGLDFQGSRGANAYQASYLINHNHLVGDPTHAHAVYDPTHTHGAYTGGHSHSATDSGHNHGGGFSQSTGFFGLGSSSPLISQQNTAIGYANISISAAGNLGVGVYNAYTGIGIYNSGTGVYVSSVSTGNVNFGGETTVQNYPILWCIKY